MEENNYESLDDQMMGYLEENGAIIWDGVDESGEAVFRFNLDILKDLYPPLYKQVMEEIDQDLLKLYENGFVEVEYDEELNAMFKISDKGKEFFETNPKPPFLD